MDKQIVLRLILDSIACAKRSKTADFSATGPTPP